MTASTLAARSPGFRATPNPRARRFPLRILGLLFLALLSPTARSAPALEYEIKAVFLFNFLQFAEWPDHAFAGPDAPFVIGILGNDPFGPLLEETVKGETINQRPIVIRRHQTTDGADTCHLLFISRSETRRLAPILQTIADHPVLTVSDADDFAARGGAIELVTVHGRVRLKINPRATKTAGLAISSKLLRPAEIVTADNSDR